MQFAILIKQQPKGKIKRSHLTPFNSICSLREIASGTFVMILEEHLNKRKNGNKELLPCSTKNILLLIKNDTKEWTEKLASFYWIGELNYFMIFVVDLRQIYQHQERFKEWTTNLFQRIHLAFIMGYENQNPTSQNERGH